MKSRKTLLSSKSAFYCALVLALFSAADVFARPIWSGDNANARGLTNDWAGPFQVHSSGSFSTAIPSRGLLGIGFSGGGEYQGGQAPSFEYPSGSDIQYLFAGALWVGGIVGEDTLVSVGADGWTGAQDFNPNSENVGVSIVSGRADQNYRSEYADSAVSRFQIRPHKPLNIQVTQTSHSWESEPYDDELVIEYLIRNIGTDTIKFFWVGTYHDVDIGSGEDANYYFDDFTGFLPNTGIAYGIDNNGLNGPIGPNGFSEFSPRGVYGVTVLDFQPPVTTEPNYNWWASNGNPLLDFGPRRAGTPADPFRDFGGFIGTPEGDENKYYILSHPEQDYDQMRMKLDNTGAGWLATDGFLNGSDIANGHDTRFLLSQGGIDLAPGDSALFVIAIVVGADVHVDAANFQNLWDETNPDAFYSSLDLSDLEANVAAIKSLYGQGYITPIVSPPPPVSLVDPQAQEPTIEWIYSENQFVSGYNVYLAPLPDAGIFCNLLPVDTPYLCAANQITWTPITTDHFTLTDLEDGRWYQVGVAVAETEGRFPRISDPMVFQYGAPGAPSLVGSFANADQVENQYQVSGNTVEISWVNSADDASWYNIYRFTDADIPSEITTAHSIVPGSCSTTDDCDAVVVRGDTLHYCLSRYKPHAMVSDLSTTFSETIDSAGIFYYQVTAIDTLGIESVASNKLTVYVRPDILAPLVVYMYDTTNGHRFSRMEYDSLTSWYQTTLGRFDPMFVRKRAPTAGSDEPRLKYSTFGGFRTLLIDDPTRWVGMLNGASDGREGGANGVLRDFARVGGEIIYLGSGSSISKNELGVDEASVGSFSEGSIGRWVLGLDSLAFIGPHTPDSLYNPIGAVAKLDGWPDLTYHHSLWRYPASDNEGPIKYKGALYPAGENIETLYTFVSGMDPLSELHGLPTGVKYTGEFHIAYTILTSPYEWEPEQARAFFTKILGDFPTGVAGSNPEEPTLPENFSLSQNYPNPFNPSTTINYALPRASDVVLSIYNLLGQKIATLVDTRVEAGNHVASWNATEFASGMYFVQLKTSDTKLTRKMTLLK